VQVTFIVQLQTLSFFLFVGCLLRSTPNLTFFLCLLVCLCCPTLDAPSICFFMHFHPLTLTPFFLYARHRLGHFILEIPPISFFLFLVSHGSLLKFIASNIDKIAPLLFFRSIVIITHGRCCHLRGLHNPFHSCPSP
jgi:hypothetical protein